MPLTIASNIAALNAQRRLTQTTGDLTKVFEHLSSGLRINRAADDAAGLAISESLRIDTRVYTQAIRNVNDGLSVLSVAEGALQELSSVTVRQRELATQAANGTYTVKQRLALHREANALVDEFNRIVQGLEFNEMVLYGDGPQEFRVQLGYGTDESILSELGDELARAIGDGTFTQGLSNTTGTLPKRIALSDYNGDGVLDAAVVERTPNSVAVFLGNGNGTFKARVTFVTAFAPESISTADLNNDGVTDFVIGDNDYGVTTLLGNGNGTFAAHRTYVAGGANIEDITTADFNNDGIADIAGVQYAPSGEVYILLGNGNGTFKAQTSYNHFANPSAIQAGDINGDNIQDLVVGDKGSGQLTVFVGNGNGSFRARVVYDANVSNKVELGDLNGDGALDVSSAYGSTVTVLLGNGDGSFKAKVTYVTGAGSFDVEVADINGDGLLDLSTAGYANNNLNVLIGNGNGTFKSRLLTSGTTALGDLAVGDFNGDGANDVVSANYFNTSMSVFISNTHDVATTPYLNLATQTTAREAMDIIDTTLRRIGAELGMIGSSQSRLGAAISTVAVKRENFTAAGSQIVDADIADESARLVRQRILQQAGASVLAQANIQPQLALTLLSGR